MNNTTLMGRLVASPTIYNNESAEDIRARFTLAVPRRFSKDNKADFISCVCFKSNARFAQQYLTKGQRITVQGKLCSSQYDIQIQKNKSKRITSIDVIVTEMDFADAKKEV